MARVKALATGPLKTIVAIFTNVKVTDKHAINAAKKYTFNTTAAVKVGDLITSPAYGTSIQVTMIMDEVYRYADVKDGKLYKSAVDSSYLVAIKTLVVAEATADDKVYGHLIK